MIILDTHVHMYPSYDAGKLLRLCSQRLHALVPDAVPVACLTERYDCHFYAALCERGLPENQHVIGCEILENGRAVMIRFGQGVPPLFVLPGRQIATSDGLEVHCIGNDAAIADGFTTQETIGRCRELDALAVLPWGVGKWLFRRRRIVEKMLSIFSPSDLILGDSAMRPVIWPEPLPMRRGRANGFRILAGSDPLPHEKSGTWIGRYATLADMRFDAECPSRTCLRALQEAKLSHLGVRPWPVGFAKRMAG